MLTPRTVVVPGHGTPVDREFVQDQRADISDVGELIRSLYAQGVPAGEALRIGAGESSAAGMGPSGWPYPTAQLAYAVSRGYAQLATAAERAGDPLAGRTPARLPLGGTTIPLA